MRVAGRASIGVPIGATGDPEGSRDAPDHKKPRPHWDVWRGLRSYWGDANHLSGFCQTPDAILAHDSTGKGTLMLLALLVYAVELPTYEYCHPPKGVENAMGGVDSWYCNLLDKIDDAEARRVDRANGIFDASRPPIERTIDRVDSLDRLRLCTLRSAAIFAAQDEPSLTLARMAIRTCRRERESMSYFSYQSIASQKDADDWMASNLDAIEAEAQNAVILLRAGKAPDINGEY